MKHYKDSNNNIYAYELDGSQDSIIPIKYIAITDSEADAILLSQVIPLTYQQLRAIAYPPMSNYLDAIVKNDSIALKAYIDACLAVKAKYPKL